MTPETASYILTIIGSLTFLIVLILLITQLLSKRDSKGTFAGVEEQFRGARTEAQDSAKSLREEVTRILTSTNDSLVHTLTALGKSNSEQTDGMARQIKDLQDTNQTKLDEIRKENIDGLKNSNDTIAHTLKELGKQQGDKLDALTLQLKELIDSNRGALDRIKDSVNERVIELQESNEKKLDEMRKTVDEKLHETLEKRLGESFNVVNEQLKTVHQGLGEMQALAIGVGDLKKVLSNVKARGTFAEVQLGGILEQILTANQYARNVQVNPNASGRVEYAVRFPGPRNDPESKVWLPIDSKFPQEDYLRIQAAADAGDVEGTQLAVEMFARAIKHSAKEIHDKYICPPSTTDVAILFLCTEGLYAEVLRHDGLADELQQKYRILVAGPTNLAALLTTFRMGFRTLAIEQRASEVWKVLGAVKTEFSKFGDILDKVKKQLDTATKTIEDTGVRRRMMARKLADVQELSEAETNEVLALSTDDILDPLLETLLPDDEDDHNNKDEPLFQPDPDDIPF